MKKGDKRTLVILTIIVFGGNYGIQADTEHEQVRLPHACRPAQPGARYAGRLAAVGSLQGTSEEERGQAQLCAA